MSDNTKLSQQLVRIARGFAFLILLAIVIGVLIYLRQGPFDGIARWLSQSSDPRSALIVFSFLASMIVVFLVRLGFEFHILDRLISSELVKQYIAGLHFWILIPLLFIGILIFWRYFPSCVPPTSVQFYVGGTEKVYEPLSLMEVKAGESLTLVARTADKNETLSCYWEYSGTAFGGLKSQSSGCQISLLFAPQAQGEGIITVSTKQNFCPQASLFSIRVLVKP